MFTIPVLLSAVLYAATFLWVTLLWPISFLMYVPLFWCQFASYKQAFVRGVLWGAVAYGATVWALLDLIVYVGKGPWRFVCAIGFVLYFSCLSALWFMSAYAIWRITARWWLGWIISTVLYGALVYYGILYGLTGAWQGYPLACPLVPLMNQPKLLGLLPYTGWIFLCMAFCSLQAGIAYKKKYLIFLGGLPFLVGWLCVQERHHIEKYDFIAPCPAFFCETQPYERAQEVCDALLKAEYCTPQAKMIVLPESAFPFPLEEHSYAVAMWQNNGNLFEKYLVVPAHYRKSQTELYNSVYLLHRGRIIHRYDKKELLPFFEKGCSLNPFLKKCHTLFLKDKEEFVPGLPLQPSFKLPDGQDVQFCICSELLWNFPQKGIVIAVVHDGHYRYSYFPFLFKLLASFKANLYKVPLIYVAWTCQLVLS